MARPTVCVIGAGTAGLEGLLAARDRLGSQADLRLVAPDSEFRYRPMTTASLFRPAREAAVAVGDLAAHVGARWVGDRVASVHEGERSLLTRDGDTVEFDFLLLALGARPRRVLGQGHVWARGGDPGFLDEIIQDIVAGDVGSVAVAVPRGARWPVPAYELAMVLAWSAIGTDARITLITAEQQPLAAIGPAATEAVTGELDAAGVETITGVEVIDEPEHESRAPAPAGLIVLAEDSEQQAGALIGKPSDPARVRLGAGASLEFDRLISLPTVVGPYLAGVASDAAGFVEVDTTLRACGSERVWAAGGCIAAGLEHSALSARQADAAIEGIATASGQPATGSGSPELTGIILTGQRDRWRAENPVGTREPSTRCLWWPPGRAVGRMLAQRIAAWDPLVHQSLPSHPGGLVISAPIALGCTETASAIGSAEVNDEVRAARLRDIENRQLMAVRRRARDADTELRALSEQLDRFAGHEQQIVHGLKEHGYLQHYGERRR